MAEISPYEFGRLTQAVKNLSDKIDSVKDEVKENRKGIDGLNSQINRGKGMVFGMLLTAGGIGAGLTAGFTKWLGK